MDYKITNIIEKATHWIKGEIPILREVSNQSGINRQGI
jgi:hypothetical protein